MSTTTAAVAADQLLINQHITYGLNKSNLHLLGCDRPHNKYSFLLLYQKSVPQDNGAMTHRSKNRHLFPSNI